MKALSRGAIGPCEIVTSGPRTGRHPWVASPIGVRTGGAAVVLRPRREIEAVEATQWVEARETEVDEWVAVEVEVGAGIGAEAGAGIPAAGVVAIRAVEGAGIQGAAVVEAEGIADRNTTSAQ